MSSSCPAETNFAVYVLLFRLPFYRKNFSHSHLDKKFAQRCKRNSQSVQKTEERRNGQMAQKMAWIQISYLTISVLRPLNMVSNENTPPLLLCLRIRKATAATNCNCIPRTKPIFLPRLALRR